MISLNEINARASVPSDLRYRARFSGRGASWDTDAAAFSFDDFLGDDMKKLRMPPLDGATAGCVGGVYVSALNCEII